MAVDFTMQVECERASCNNSGEFEPVEYMTALERTVGYDDLKKVTNGAFEVEDGEEYCSECLEEMRD